MKPKFSNLLSSLEDSTEEMVLQEQSKFFSEKPNIPFSFNISKDKVEHIRKYVDKKRRNPSYFHYNNSDALRDAISEMKGKYDIQQRPDEVKNPIRKGRPYFLTDEATKLKTSFLISEADRNFIYNFIYAHQNSEEFFGKERFLEYALKELEL